MIINHRYKFIFVKTKKTAGTSIEIALSAFCGKGDVITEIGRDDELIRQGLGFRGPQNHNVPFRFYGKKDWLKSAWTRIPKHFSQHSSGLFVRSNVEDAIWSSYFKFCFERNPYDKAVSRYYWSTKEPRPALSDYLDSVPVDQLSNWYLYTINDQIAVDFVGCYESLEDDLTEVARLLRMPQIPELPKAKSHHRLDRRHYSAVIDSRARARIELVCAKEIGTFNYSWQIPHDKISNSLGCSENRGLESSCYA